MRLRPLVLAVITIPLFACFPGPHKDRLYSNEMAAIRTLTIINTAQTQYRAAYGRYATRLAELGPPRSGNAASAAADLIPGDLAQGIRRGYLFTMVGSPQGYSADANPQVYNTTGTRSFFTDQSTVIREHTGNEPASANDPEIK